MASAVAWRGPLSPLYPAGSRPTPPDPARPRPTPPDPARPRQVHLAERTERRVAEQQLGSLLCAVQTHFARVRDRLKGKRTLLLTLLPLLLLSVRADPDLGPRPRPECHSLALALALALVLVLAQA
jgi:hypothetical protein